MRSFRKSGSVPGMRIAIWGKTKETPIFKDQAKEEKLIKYGHRVAT